MGENHGKKHNNPFLVVHSMLMGDPAMQHNWTALLNCQINIMSAAQVHSIGC
jgi:hypothetical protein